MITGGTYFLNALSLDYPIIEWVETAKQFCDEVILVDMGSTDGTRRAIRNRFGKSVKIISEKWQFTQHYHEGIPRNRILETAQHKWVYLTDCDEILHEKDFDKVHKLAETVVEIYWAKLLNFYGSCYLLRLGSVNWKPFLMRNDVGIYYGPPLGRTTASAHTPLVDLKDKPRRLARRHRQSEYTDIRLYHYGKCRKAEAIAKSVNFYELQSRARTGRKYKRKPLLTAKQCRLKRPRRQDARKWLGGHPRVMTNWAQEHWKVHGWEA